MFVVGDVDIGSSVQYLGVCDCIAKGDDELIELSRVEI